MNTKQAIISAVTFIWIGFICAISFMEAWMKFQAPGITTELGLGIGKLVFAALNNVELICAGLILFISLISKNQKNLRSAWLIIAFVILLIDTVWLLPALSDRATAIISGDNLPSSYLHITYVGLEMIKTICLFLFGLRFLTLKINNR